MKHTCFSCQKYTQLVSKSFDSKLTLGERLGLAFHHCICLYCRRFFRQARVIDSGAEKLAEKLDGANRETDSNKPCLTRIQKCVIEEEKIQ